MSVRPALASPPSSPIPTASAGVGSLARALPALGTKATPVWGAALLANMPIGTLNYSGPLPTRTAYDPANKYLYVPDFGSNNVTIVNTVNNTIVKSLGSGDDPNFAAYDPTNGYVYVTDYGTSYDVSVYDGTTFLGKISVGQHPRSVIYNPSNGEMYVMVASGNTVDVISGMSVLHQIPCSGTPQFAAYDTSSSELYVSDVGGNNVTVINGFTAVATIAVGTGPSSILYDPSNDYVYVSDTINGNVSVIHGTSVIATLPVGSDPLEMAYDPANHFVYVPVSGSNLLTILNGTSYVANVSVDTYPSTATYAPSTNEVYLTDFAGGNVSVIRGTSEVARIHTGQEPYFGLYDPANGEVYVTNYVDGNVTAVGNISSPWYVTFNESGLTPGTSWAASVNVSEAIGNTSSLALVEANGSYTYSIPPVAGYVAHGGSFTIASDDPTVTVVFERTYPLYLNETGLPTLTIWTARLAGTNLTSSSNSIEFQEPNGSYGYAIQPIPGFSATWNGRVVVNDSPITVRIVFVLQTYPVTFQEVGLSTGTVWSVDLGPTLRSGNGTSILFSMSNSTYQYSIGAIPGYDVLPPGTVVVNGLAINVPLTFLPATFPVTFESTGLRPGTSWSISVDGTAHATTKGSITLPLSNGTVTYVPGQVPGFLAPSPGSSVVRGMAMMIPIDYTLIPVAPPNYAVAFSESGLPASTSWSLRLNGTSGSATGPTITFEVPNGTYGYVVGGVPGFVTGWRSSVTVNGAGQTVPVAFAPMNYTVTFLESGLPDGTPWTVTIDGVTTLSTQTDLTVLAPNGTYAYAPGGPSGYGSPASGTVTVAGTNPAPVTVDFRSNGGASFLGLTLPVAIGLIGGIGAAIVIAAVLLSRRRPRSGSAAEPPPETSSGDAPEGPADAPDPLEGP